VTLYIHFNKMDGGDYLLTSICELKKEPTNLLYSLWADCNRKHDTLECDCCEVCCDGHSTCGPNPKKQPQGDRRDLNKVEDGGDDNGDDNDNDNDRDSEKDDLTPPIESRNKRSLQRKEEKKHRLEPWFTKGWMNPNN